MTDMRLRQFRASDIDWLTEQHQLRYRLDEGFDDTFGVLVRQILENFAASHDPKSERGWIAESATGQPLGSIFCVRLDEDTAKLRLFFLLPEARGMRMGKALLDACIGFAKECGYKGMTLWTHESHEAACALYAKNNFTLEKSVPVHSFGIDLVEQTWSLRFD